MAGSAQRRASKTSQSAQALSRKAVEASWDSPLPAVRASWRSWRAWLSPNLARRKGIGKALCQQVMDWSRYAGASELELEVRASSDGALALYRSLGFVEQGRRRDYYRNPTEDAVLMAVPLQT